MLKLPDYQGMASKAPGYSTQKLVIRNVETGMALGGRNIGSVYPLVTSTPFYQGINMGKPG